MKSNNRITTYKNSIKKTFPPTHKDSEGLFGPGSMHWKLYREPSIIVASYRALMLQVAHPAVADGVHQFSAFKKDYLGRAERTFTNMISIYFGDKQTALRSGFHLFSMHGRIRGTIELNDGKSRSYAANDPDLLCWVLVTIVEATLHAYEKTVRMLSTEEKEQFFEETKLIAILMGIPPENYPENLKAFYHYFQGMIDGDTLRVDDLTLDLAVAIFKPPFFPSYIAKTLAAGGLPPRWRKAYQLNYDKSKRKSFYVIVLLAKWSKKLTPHPFGYAPAWYQAHYRVAKANGLRPKVVDTFFNWVSKLPVLKGVTLANH
ncbi:MAG: oxygenase MpaB family protein [Saprospiraceae bacterium]